MTTRVPIRYGGTGANSASAARTALGVPPLAAYDTANSAYDQANAAYAQANAAYDAANNAQVTVYANNASNVTTQNVNFVNTATVTVTVTADGSNANVEFTAAPQTVVNDTYTAAGNTAAAATANIANGLFAISTSAYDQANAAYGQANDAYTAANNRVLKSGDVMTGSLFIQNIIPTGNNIYDIGSSANQIGNVYSQNTISTNITLNGNNGLGGALSFPNTAFSWNWNGGTFSVSGQESGPSGLFFDSTGTRLYICGTTGDDVNQYSLSTAWQVNTASYIRTSATVADTAPSGIFFKDDGTKMYLSGDQTELVLQYSLSEAWNIATTSLETSYNTYTQDTGLFDLYIKPDGTKMYTLGYTNDRVYEYDLGTAWFANTATFVQSFAVGAQASTPAGLDFSSDGTKMWVAGYGTDRVFEYNLSTPWDISTAVSVGFFYVGFEELTAQSVWVEPSQNKAWIVGSSSDAIREYSTNTTSILIDSTTLSVNAARTQFAGNVVVNQLHGRSGWYTESTLSVGSTTTLSGTATFQGAVGASTTTGTIDLGTSQTTGVFRVGGVNQTGVIFIGRSVATQFVGIANGATGSGNTKTVNIGTGGISGSNTDILLGSNVSGARGNTRIVTPSTVVSGNLMVGSDDIPTSNLHVVGNANITLGINTSTVNASTINATTGLITTVNAQTFVTSTGANVYATAISAYAQANAAYGQANAAYGQANAAYGQANLAYTAANNSNLLSGGSIAGNLTISGNLVVQGNATTINVSNLSVNDSIILLSANATGDVGDIGFVGHFDRGATATHAGIVRIHTLNEFQIFDNYELEPTNNVIDIANYNYRLGNVRFNTLNANSVLILGNSVATQANLTLAHDAANNRVLKAGDTMTGSLLFNFSNSNVDIRQQSTNIASIEMGGAGGSLIDMKSPFSDDYDFRIITIQGSTEFLSNNAAQVVSFTGANVNFDAGTLFVDSVANEVGIGTTTPTAKLDIVDSVNDTEVLRVRTSGGNSGSVKGIAHLGLHYFSTGNNSPVRISVEEVDNADFRGHLLFSTRSTEDDTAPTERMRIDANGNVGIGITSPSKKLHVVGSTIISDGATPANNATLLVQDDGVANTVTSSATFRIANDGSGGSFAVFEASSGVSNTVITNAGNMGIGTTTPAYKLDVVGVVRATGNVFVGTGAGTQAGDDNLIRPTSTNAFLNIKGGAGRAKFVLGNDGVVISSGTTDQIAFYTNAAATTTGTERMRIDLNGNVSIGTTSTTYKLEVNGSFAATTKSFVINHPTKPGMKLRYGSLEGPENGVYVRGKLTGNVIELPDYWTGLVDSESITVNLTPIGKYQKLFIEKIEDNKVYVASENWFGQINCYYTVFAERKDVEKLVVEY